MALSEFLIAGIKCIAQIGIIDTFRATINRSRSRLIKSCVGPEMAFRLVKGDPRTVLLRTGTMDWVVFNQIFVRGEYDIEKFPQWIQVKKKYDELLSLGKQPTFIDCGANIGLSAIWFSLKFPESRIIAIELEKRNFKQLCKNIIPFPNITAVHAAVWGDITNLKIHNTQAATHAFSVQRSSEFEDAGELVNCVTIDKIISDYQIDDLFCLKLDIEGGEVSVLNNSKNWISSLKVMFAELHDGDGIGLGCGMAFLKALSSVEFDLIISGELVVAVLA